MWSGGLMKCLQLFFFAVVPPNLGTYVHFIYIIGRLKVIRIIKKDSVISEKRGVVYIRVFFVWGYSFSS